MQAANRIGASTQANTFLRGLDSLRSGEKIVGKNPSTLMKTKFHLLTLAALAIFASGHDLVALFIRPEIETVPVARVIENLEAIAGKNPKDANARFNIARAHAMAFAMKSDTAQIRRGGETNGVWFNFTPPHIPFQAKPTDDPEKLKAAKEQLAKAVARYREVVKLAPNHFSARLGLAWCLQQGGDKAGAIKEFRSVMSAAWEKEKNMQSAGMDFHSVVAEGARYLTPMLDVEKDAVELAELKVRVQKVGRIMRPITPLAVPLRAGLQPEELIDATASVRFDADGSGWKHSWTWLKPNAAWLVFDPASRGEITSALQMFGSVTFWMFWQDGYQALAALDNDRNGRLEGSELAGLALWHDANGNGVSEPGEVQPVGKHGIVSIACTAQAGKKSTVAAWSAAGVTFSDGRTWPTYDLILQRRGVDVASQPSPRSSRSSSSSPR